MALVMAEVEPTGARRQPQLTQRRLGIEDDLAAVRKAHLQQASGSRAVNIYDVALQPDVELGFDIGQDGGRQTVVLKFAQRTVGSRLGHRR